MFIILEECKKTCRNAKVWTDLYVKRTVPRMLDLSFAAVSATME